MEVQSCLWDWIGLNWIERRRKERERGREGGRGLYGKKGGKGVKKRGYLMGDEEGASKWMTRQSERGRGSGVAWHLHGANETHKNITLFVYLFCAA